MEKFRSNIIKPTEDERGIRVLTAPGKIARADLLRAFEAEPNVHVVDSRRSDDIFPDKETYDEFGEVPENILKVLRRISAACRDYLSGFLMLDTRTTEQRDAWEVDMQQRYGDDFNIVYNNSKLRIAAMSRITSPMLTAEHLLAARGDHPEALAKLRTLKKRLPPSLIPPRQKIIWDEEHRIEKIVAVPEYNNLTLPDKLEVVQSMEGIAREYLRLVTAPESQNS